MYDLIYGGYQFKDEIQKLFPTAKIEDASDDIHLDRISIELEMEKKEYFRIIFLNGFGEMSFNTQLFTRNGDTAPEFLKWVKEWEEKYLNILLKTTH